MNTPENDLFEISIPIKDSQQTVLVRITDQKQSLFRVQVDGLTSNEDESVIDRDMTFIGSDFPKIFKAKCLGNLRVYLGSRPNEVRDALDAGAITFSNLLLARTVSLMVEKKIPAPEAMEQATAIGRACLEWMNKTRLTAENARKFAAGR